MIYYNHARKIMFIPFPFPHAQLSVFYIFAVIPAVPFLMDQYTDETWLGALLTFLTVTCLAGLHEVARELENPFRNVPNEIPLVTLQAMFNESLITMYAGYHPDHYWDPETFRKRNNWKPSTEPVMKKPPTEPAINEGKELAPASTDASKNSEAGTTDVGELILLLQEQSKEIERLRNLVEGSDRFSDNEETSKVHFE